MNYFSHSAKGTSWEKKEHKYTKKENGKYYYGNETNSDTGAKVSTNSGYTDEELLELARKDPSELTDEELAAVYQFPDQVKANHSTSKEVIEKGKQYVNDVLEEIKKLAKIASKPY